MAFSSTSVSAPNFNSIKTERTPVAAKPFRVTFIGRVKPLRSPRYPAFNPLHLQSEPNNRLTRRAPPAAIVGIGTAGASPEQEESHRATEEELATRIGGAGAPEPEREESCRPKATKLRSYVMIAALFLNRNRIAVWGWNVCKFLWFCFFNVKRIELSNFVWFCLVVSALSAVDFPSKISALIVSFVRLFAEFMACATGEYGDKSVWEHMAEQFK